MYSYEGGRSIGDSFQITRTSCMKVPDDVASFWAMDWLHYLTIYLAKRFHVAVRLSSSNRLRTKSDTRGVAECVIDVLTTFWRRLWSIKAGFH